ncbi:hypothetical protein [uncultured Sphingomonas sp.]|uniref:hypothetical protein n=1 Tax=uncultured Sphingomonas sp. TaxID=158754 RepID=UPI0025D1494B|nr:hypothetical protein [uncultured Sphingomonas sp.]
MSGERIWHSPDLRDMHSDTQRLRNHHLGGKRFTDLLQGVMDMLVAADVELVAADTPTQVNEGDR